MNNQVVNFSFEYWNEFVQLINNHWKKNHPITHRPLFEWQYSGYGPMKGVKRSKLLFVDGKLKGFRGVIPGQYQLHSTALLNGCSFAVWIVTSDCRGKGLGYAMMEKIAEEFNVMCSLGSNEKTSVPIYRRNKFAYMDALHRYVAPLDNLGYQELCHSPIAPLLIDEWMHSIDLSNPVEPRDVDSESLANLWFRIRRKMEFFGLHRTAEFWNWRYIHNYGFIYHIFGDPVNPGIIIGRIERVFNANMNKPSERSVFRIMEILPAAEAAWDNMEDLSMTILLHRVLAWAKEKGCVAADFQISNRCLHQLMISSGFKYQNKDYLPKEAGLAGLFQPFRLKPNPINGTYFIRDDHGGLVELDREATYFVKSDNDMDRTNFWPIIQ